MNKSNTTLLSGDTEIKNLTIRGREFQFYAPKTLDSFIDPKNVFHDFPLWAKIWEASIILADHLARMAAEPGKRLLEIGAGLGVVGIVGAAFGHQMTVTEINPDAVRFAQANARLNLRDGECLPEMKQLDWNRPGSEQTYDYIVGSEVVYKESDFEPIRHLIENYLKPGGEVILAEGIRETSMSFFREMQNDFQLKAVKKILRSKTEAISVILCRMRPKD